MSKNVTRKSPSGPFQKRSQTSKRQSLLRSLVPNLFKDKIQPSQHTQDQPLQSSPAGGCSSRSPRQPEAWRRNAALQEPRSHTRGEAPSPHSDLTDLQSELSLPRSFSTAEKQPLLSHVWPFPSIELLLQSWALTSQPAQWGCTGRSSSAQKKYRTIVQNVWFLSSVTAILRGFFNSQKSNTRPSNSLDGRRHYSPKIVNSGLKVCCSV